MPRPGPGLEVGYRAHGGQARGHRADRVELRWPRGGAGATHQAHLELPGRQPGGIGHLPGVDVDTGEVVGLPRPGRTAREPVAGRPSAERVPARHGPVGGATAHLDLHPAVPRGGGRPRGDQLGEAEARLDPLREPAADVVALAGVAALLDRVDQLEPTLADPQAGRSAGAQVGTGRPGGVVDLPGRRAAVGSVGGVAGDRTRGKPRTEQRAEREGGDEEGLAHPPTVARKDHSCPRSHRIRRCVPGTPPPLEWRE